MRIFITIILFIFLRLPIQAQEIEWLSFPQLSDSLDVNPKPVFLFFHTDWCSYCRKMEKDVFTNKEVIKILNNQFYAVKFDAESKESFIFDGQLLKNSNLQSKASLHEIVVLLASRKEGFAFPTTLIFDKNFRVIKRKFSYLSSKKLLDLLKIH